jgi:hypothetical protein
MLSEDIDFELEDFLQIESTHNLLFNPSKFDIMKYAISSEILQNIPVIEASIAPNIIKYIKTYFVFNSKIHLDAIKKIKEFLDFNNIPYSYLNFKFNILLNCGPDVVQFIVYNNSGEFSKNIENGNMVLELYSFSREGCYYDIYFTLKLALCSDDHVIKINYEDEL